MSTTILQLEEENKRLKYLLVRAEVALRQADIFVVNAERWDKMNVLDLPHKSTQALESITSIIKQINEEV